MEFFSHRFYKPVDAESELRQSSGLVPNGVFLLSHPNAGRMYRGLQTAREVQGSTGGTDITFKSMLIVYKKFKRDFASDEKKQEYL